MCGLYITLTEQRPRRSVPTDLVPTVQESKHEYLQPRWSAEAEHCGSLQGAVDWGQFSLLSNEKLVHLCVCVCACVAIPATNSCLSACSEA